MIINYKQLKDIRNNHKNKTIVLLLGSFDLLHYEHLRCINDAKKLGDILVVAVKDNNYVKEKGLNRPIINEKQRLAMVDNLKSVDYTILVHKNINSRLVHKYKDILQDKANIEWCKAFFDIFKNLLPDILYCGVLKKYQKGRDLMATLFNTKIITRKRTGIVTTTKIINKIKRTSTI